MRSCRRKGPECSTTGAGFEYGHGAKRMLFKAALAFAVVASLCIVALHGRRAVEDGAVLEHEVEAQLRALREHLFKS